jgi:hypothetical protein
MSELKNKAVAAPDDEEIDVAADSKEFLRQRRIKPGETELVPLRAPYPLFCTDCKARQALGTTVLFDKLTRAFLCTACGVTAPGSADVPSASNAP